MAELFKSVPGTVYAVELKMKAGQVSIPAELADPWLKEPGQASTVLFSTMEWQQATNQQFSNSLDGSVYIYVFGDQMGKIIMSGIAFDKLCEGKGETGLAKVLKYYKNNRASQRASPIQVNLAEQIVQGFLTAATVRAIGSATGPEAVLHQYSLEISALP